MDRTMACETYRLAVKNYPRNDCRAAPVRPRKRGQANKPLNGMSNLNLLASNSKRASRHAFWGNFGPVPGAWATGPRSPPANRQGLLTRLDFSARSVSLLPAMRDLSGTTLGNYEVVERLAAGGMAIVYRAVQHPLGREVALKVLTPALVECLPTSASPGARRLPPT